MIRANILNDAKTCVCSDRNAQYGEPEDNFGVIASLWGAYLGSPVSARDVALMMVLFKVGRAQTALGYKQDNYVDMAGYAACAGEVDHDSGRSSQKMGTDAKFCCGADQRCE